MDPTPLSEDSSPENRELENFIRRLGGLLPGDAPVDWQESRRRCGEVLAPLTQEPANIRLAALFDGEPYLVGGDEHHIIHVESDADRIYKLTHGDNFGCRSYFSPHDPELVGRHFHGTGNADPFHYLQRWVLLNSMSEYQTRFEGVVPPSAAGHLPRFCISQPTLPPQTPTCVNPAAEEIAQALAQYGYRKISGDAFLNDETKILLTDAAPRNVRIIGEAAILFDALAELATRQVLEWAASRPA